MQGIEDTSAASKAVFQASLLYLATLVSSMGFLVLIFVYPDLCLNVVKKSKEAGKDDEVSSSKEEEFFEDELGSSSEDFHYDPNDRKTLYSFFKKDKIEVTEIPSPGEVEKSK